MLRIDKFFEVNPGRFFYLLLLLAIPAFFINLGLQPLFADEPTRANVALEMILTGKYAVPTIGGEYYYNKPPLYNWILAACYLVTRSFSEFVTRLPALVPLFLFAITIYKAASFFLKDQRIGAVAGLFSLLYGRMISYDSMIGHIDIMYSWFTFISFMLIFFFYQKKNWFWLFFASYTITGITFLMKGLPSIVFQGITILTLLAYTKNLKQLFSWQHILSGIFCLLIIGTYFFIYYLHNPALGAYFSTIWNQSSQRTAANTAISKTISYVLLFPFDQLWQLFPASLLIIFCLNKRFFKGIKVNKFLAFISLVFLANVLVYWASPETRPRYILMLYPLVLIVWAHAYFTYRTIHPLANKIFRIVIIVLCSLVTFAIPAALFAGLESFVDFLYLKVAVVFLFCIFLTWQMFKSNQVFIMLFLAFLVIVRLGFSWLVLPHRMAHSSRLAEKELAVDAGKTAKNSPFYFYQYHPHILDLPNHHKYIFYIEATRMAPVKFTETDTLPGYYFTFDRDLSNPAAEQVKTYRNNLKLFRVP